MIDNRLVEMMQCPVCQSAPLRVDSEVAGAAATALICAAQGHQFPVRNGIPALMPRGLTAELVVQDSTWRHWRRQLRNFMAWRTMTYGHAQPEPATQVQPAKSEFQQSFFEYVGLAQATAPGALLDIGSAAGDSRIYLGKGWQYCGIDPLPISANYDFWMVQGVGECLPFQAAQFEAVLIMQTLDHCADARQLLTEAQRVLKPGGRLLVQQVVNRRRNAAFHRRVWRRLKQAFKYAGADPNDTKMLQFSPASLEGLVGAYFTIAEMRVIENNHVFLSATRR